MDNHVNPGKTAPRYGTPIFMPPEMVERKQSGPFTDLWALGIIIYKLHAGYYPF